MNHQWKGRAILDPKDIDKLEHESAQKEMGAHKLERTAAEDAAYTEYKQARHMEGAGYHLRNLRNAVSNGAREDAEKHNTMYKMHAQALGHNAHHPPSQAIQFAAARGGTCGSFKNHPSDALLMHGPLGKAQREALNFYPLAKADGDGSGDQGADKSPEHEAPEAASSDSSPDSSSPPSASPAPPDQAAAPKPPSADVPQVRGMHDAGHSDAGPQHFDKGSVVVYHQGKGPGHVPPSWIGTVVAHHMIKIHSGQRPGHHHFYELVWRTPEGQQIEDFLPQEQVLPRGKSRGA